MSMETSVLVCEYCSATDRVTVVVCTLTEVIALFCWSPEPTL